MLAPAPISSWPRAESLPHLVELNDRVFKVFDSCVEHLLGFLPFLQGAALNISSVFQGPQFAFDPSLSLRDTEKKSKARFRVLHIAVDCMWTWIHLFDGRHVAFNVFLVKDDHLNELIKVETAISPCVRAANFKQPRTHTQKKRLTSFFKNQVLFQTLQGSS